ncbi:uncharacterized protein TNCV_1022361 [Trichonephila clavipes]|nr:uncharacterized protein TNCV_1022361 [Trichonephila clavipes]
MQRDCALRIASRGRLMSCSVEYKTGKQSLFEYAESFIKEDLRYTCHYTTPLKLLQLERGMAEAGWSARQIARQLGRSDCVVRRCWHQWMRKISFIRRQGSGRPQWTSRRENRHISRHLEARARSKSLSPDEIANLLREISENESDCGELAVLL